MTNFNPKNRSELPDVLDRLFAGRLNRIRFDLKTKEMTILPSGRQIFPISTGGNSRPLGSIEHLVHEMSHFVEIDEKRMHKLHFGLTPGNPPSTGDSEKRWEKIRERELRILALQCNVLERLDPSTEILENHIVAEVRALSQMIPHARRAYGSAYIYGEEGTLISCIRKSLESMRQTIEFSFENFEHEWFRRMDIVDKIEREEIPKILARNAQFLNLTNSFQSTWDGPKQGYVVFTAATTNHTHGLMGAAAVIVKDGKIIDHQSKNLGNIAQSVAEYHGFLLGLHLVRKNSVDSGSITTGSHTVISQIGNGTPCRHESLVPLRNLVKEVMASMPRIEIDWNDGIGYKLARDAAMNAVDDIAVNSDEYDPSTPFGHALVSEDIDPPEKTPASEPKYHIAVTSTPKEIGPLDVHLTYNNEDATIPGVSMKFARTLKAGLRDADGFQIRIARHVTTGENE